MANAAAEANPATSSSFVQKHATKLVVLFYCRVKPDLPKRKRGRLEPVKGQPTH